MKLYMFRTGRLSIISSLFTLHSEMVYVIQVCRQLFALLQPPSSRYVTGPTQSWTNV